MEKKKRLKTAPKRRLVDTVLERFQNSIFSGQYQVGDKLPTETELMKQFSVGRSTVREAVKILTHAEILEVRHGAGTFVKSAGLPKGYSMLQKDYPLQHIYEVRKMLDLQVCELAVVNRTEEDIEKMQCYLKQRKEALDSGNYSEYVEADVKFHYAVARSTKNELLMDMYDAFCSTLKEYLSHLIVKDIRHYDDSTLIHNQLLSAIKEKSAEKAKYLTLMNLKEI